MKLSNKTVHTLKKDFPIFKNNPGLIYLDNAATSQKPKQVIDVLKKFYEKEYANVHRGVYRLSSNATELYLKSKEIIAEFIGAKPEEIIYTRNTTESLNLLSYTLPSIINATNKKRDEIVLTEMEHHSNLIPWQQLAKRGGWKLKFIKLKGYELDMEDFKKKVSKKTAVVALCHVSNSLGTINPVQEIIKIAKEKGALTVIDAAQSVPHMKVDVLKVGADFLAFSGHKMMAPTGIGVLYGKKQLLEKMQPFMFGGEMIKKVTLNSATWADLPAKFEAGTPHIAGAIGLGEAINYIKKIGIENIEEWEKKLLDYTLEKIKDIKGIKIYNSGKNSSGILSFNLEGIHPHDVASLLDEQGIAIRAGHHCNMPLMKILGVPGTCRISFYLYNTFEDIDALISTLKKIKDKFKK
ncbi:MAG: cysteine desulfurase [Candidatus Pacearchaeota archaeon]|nr:MAG: cysteine desulfurase [Candidatus Pacearchaeota archaeon]